MLTFLLKAKFGEAYDPETLFHGELADLTRKIHADLPSPRTTAPKSISTEGPFTREALSQIAQAIVLDSPRSGWWSMSRDERVAFIQTVVVAPHSLSEGQLDTLFDYTESVLFNQRRIVGAADEAGEP